MLPHKASSISDHSLCRIVNLSLYSSLSLCKQTEVLSIKINSKSSCKSSSFYLHSNHSSFPQGSYKRNQSLLFFLLFNPLHHDVSIPTHKTLMWLLPWLLISSWLLISMNAFSVFILFDLLAKID